MKSDAESFARIARGIDRIQSGGMVIMVDDEDRENEGDLICSAEDVTAEQINFMAKEGRGLICLSLPRSQLQIAFCRPVINANGHERSKR